MTNIEDDLRTGSIHERRRDMDDGVDTWDVFSASDYRNRTSHKPFTACERSEVARSSITVAVNLSPYDL